MGKVVAILLTGVILIGGVTLLSLNRVSVASIERCVQQYNRAIIHSNAVSVANIVISSLFRGEEVAEFSNAQFFGSRVSLDTLHLDDNQIKIIARAFIPSKDTVTVEAIIALGQSGSSYEARAAIVTQCKLITKGLLVVDGRNHNIQGSFIPKTGTLAVSTTKSFRRKELSRIGGSYSGNDYSPRIFYPQFLVEEGAVWPKGFPDTPEEVFGGEEAGFPEGKLIEIAKSGIGGSQYVTDPKDLKWPLKSLTYVELPPGKKWKRINLKNSQGILIVHNSQINARMEHLWRGRFAGIIITDRIDRIDNQIIGAIILMSKNKREWRGWGSFRFSREAIDKAVAVLQEGVPESHLVLSWYE